MSETRFVARVEDIRERERRAGRVIWELALDRTGFGGGDTGVLVATARSGATLTIRVTQANVDEHGTVWHTVEKPLGAGTEVEGIVDARGAAAHAG